MICMFQVYFEPIKNLVMKGNPNFQGILNWILQILKTCGLLNKMSFFFSSLCLLQLVLPLPFSVAEVFQFLYTVLCKILNITSDYLCCCIRNHVYGWFHVKVGQKIQLWNPRSQILTKFGPNVPVYKIWQTAKFQHPIPIGSEVMVIWNLVQFSMFAPAAAILNFKAG